MDNFMSNSFDNFFTGFNIVFIVVSVFISLVFIFVIVSIVSPKFRGKMMSKQIKATKYMVDYSKDDLEDIGTNLGNVSVKTRKNILDENGNVLKEMTDKEAYIKKDYVKTMASAIHEGLTEEDKVYCKHCGSLIDVDSTFCKKCGKKQ